MSTNAQLSQQINTLLASWNSREAQFRAWLAGTSNGGPNGDGKYPLSDASGSTQLVDCPAKLSDTVGGPAGLSVAAKLASETARDTAIAAKDRAVQAESSITTLHTQTISHRDLAKLYRDDAAAFAAGLSAGKTAAEAARDLAIAARDAALVSEDNAAISETNAAASASAAASSAALAATFNPNAYYTKVQADTLLAAKAALSHTHAIADVTGLQAALDAKLATANFTWTNLSGKPTTFAPSAHTHAIADVTGLQTALDGKQPTGAYLTGITSAQVTGALGFTPYNATNPSGYITGITSAMVIAALNYTPLQQSGGAGQTGSKVYIGWLGSQLGLQVDTTNFGAAWPINVTGNAASVTSITSGQVTTALGFTPANKAGDTFTGAITATTVTATGNLVANSDVIVGNGKTASYLYMSDSDEGQRTLHCNSNRIGFLTQAGGWGAWCEDDGTWGTDTACNAPVFYDRNDTGYYLNPNGTTQLNTLQIAGLCIGRYNAGTDVNTANDTGSFSVRGDVNNVAAMSFHRAGAYAVNMGLGLDAVFRIGGWSMQSNCLQIFGSGAVQALNDFRAPIFYDSANTSYYVDPAATATSVNVAGTITAGGNVTAYSDARVKANVVPMGNALGRVARIRGVTYTRTDRPDTERRHGGVIAQEVEAVLPEAVFDTGPIKAVDYNAIVGLLVEAVNELRSEVEDLKGNPS